MHEDFQQKKAPEQQNEFIELDMVVQDYLNWWLFMIIFRKIKIISF